MTKTQLLITCRWVWRSFCTTACLFTILTKLLSSQIEVRLPNGQCVKGTLQYCNLHYNIAVVNNMVFPDFCAANLYHPMEIQTASEVVAVGRLFSTGRLTATRGIITDKQCNFGCNELMISTCKITKVHCSFLLWVSYFGCFHLHVSMLP